MLQWQERAVAFIADFYHRTAGGGPTAAMVAEHIGIDEQSALIFLLDLCRQGVLLPPRFWLVERPLRRGDKP
jgi:hypothetical protein